MTTLESLHSRRSKSSAKDLPSRHDKALQRCLTEFEFRFNLRKVRTVPPTLPRMAEIASMPYVEIIAVPEAMS